MKRHLSIWMLMARSTICKVLGLLLALAAADGALFALTLRQGETGFAAGLLTALTVLFFVQPVRSGDFWLIGALVVITAVALFNVTEVLHETA